PFVVVAMAPSSRGLPRSLSRQLPGVACQGFRHRSRICLESSAVAPRLIERVSCEESPMNPRSILIVIGTSAFGACMFLLVWIGNGGGAPTASGPQRLAPPPIAREMASKSKRSPDPPAAPSSEVRALQPAAAEIASEPAEQSEPKESEILLRGR